jgi:hypothetical protein
LQRTKRPQGRARKIHEFLTSSSPLSEAVQEPLKGNEDAQQYCHISLILHEPSRILLGSALPREKTFPQHVGEIKIAIGNNRYVFILQQDTNGLQNLKTLPTIRRSSKNFSWFELLIPQEWASLV